MSDAVANRPTSSPPPDLGSPATVPMIGRRPRAAPFVLAPIGVGLPVVAVSMLLSEDLATGADGVRLALAVAFCAAGVRLAKESEGWVLGMLTVLGASVAGVEFATAAWRRTNPASGWQDAVGGLAAALVVAVAVHFVLVVPDGRLRGRPARLLLGASYLAAVAVGAQRWRQAPDPAVWPLAVAAVLLGLPALVLAARRYEAVRGAARRRMQWLGLAVALCAEVALIAAVLGLLIDWPQHPVEVIAASLVLVALALIVGASPRRAASVDRPLSHAVSAAGVSAVVVAIYLVIVVGLGRVPTADERAILLLSMVAAGVCAVVYVPARVRLDRAANRLVYGPGVDPSDALDTFGARLTRALPLDELLLQLAEACTRQLGLISAEVWTGSQGKLGRAASIPDRGPGRIELGAEELPVAARAGVSGRGWAEVWVPSVLEHRGAGPLRVVAMTHLGELFGLLVLERPDGDEDFSDEDDRALAEVGRQVALALHNSALDNALRATLEEVERSNVQLEQSRARIVASGDRERRRIERNLHDGAQQHLVALAVKLRLIERVGETDPAGALAMVPEARADTLATIDELRALAHGIYPPVLMDQGLPGALAAAAGRAAITTSVSTVGVGRYPQEVEAAVYFCCVEALQNAAKYAGEAAAVEIVVAPSDDGLEFTVSDDGDGFDLEDGGGGHGFVNMADRLGALGGRVEVWSEPGRGTRITGCIVPLRGDRGG